jgi:hypothetical protein
MAIMLCKDWLGRFGVWVIALGTIAPPQLLAVEAPARMDRRETFTRSLQVMDVTLDEQSTLTGQVVSEQGTPLAGQPVVVTDGLMRIETTTDAHGNFRVAGIRGGTYQVQVGPQMQMCRAWKAGTAPPNANQGLLVVQSDQVVLGQHCGSPVACGVAGARDALANPLIFGGIVAAAIAIPVAIHNADDDPAS